MLVDLVHITTADGIRLEGAHRKPARAGVSKLDVDVIIFHHGVAGNFYGADMFDEYGDALLELGIASVRVNNRGHDPVSWAAVGSGRRRLGAAYEMMDDCRDDWESWVTFAQAEGYERIGLWGHSLGAMKSIYYMGVQHDSRVRRVVAGSPPRLSYSTFLRDKEGGTFQAFIDEAGKQISEGNPHALLDATLPVPFLGAAETHIDKYGPDENVNILKHIPNVRTPLLIMLGADEAQTMLPMRGLPGELEKLAGELDSFTFASIPGADHFYTRQRDHVWGVVSDWLAGP